MGQLIMAMVMAAVLTAILFAVISFIIALIPTAMVVIVFMAFTFIIWAGMSGTRF